jgi:alkanesulfonate monooxygenase SsuD/methylene tetrahydromethanopterin reductase-like flavin-dependent oxidoreductase (luciferase family)
MMPVSFGFAVPAGPDKGQIDKWMTDIEAAIPLIKGHFESLWMTDHFFWEDNPTYEAWTVLAYLAGCFPDFKVGPMVLGQSYRNPALLAKMASTLQALTNGRFIMGIGAGWKENEYLAYNYEFPRAGIRVEQFEDTLNIFKKLWTESGQVTYEGKHYKVTDAWCEPKPDPMIPILIGASGDRMLGLVAKYADMWNMGLCDIDKYFGKVTFKVQNAF